MKFIQNIYKGILFAPLLLMSACGDKLTEANISPNVVDPAVSNPNMVMPTIMAPSADKYLRLGWGDMAGVMQHTQHDGWFGGHNNYEWGPTDWTDYYDRLRNNDFLLKSPSKFHQGVGLTMRAFEFGNITDLWGDAPYTEALKGNKGTWEPIFDSQEIIYKGIIEDLKAAASIFATGDKDGYLQNYDTYYNGDLLKWQKFANSLLLRYYLRISDKLPDIAKAGIEGIYASGIYIKSPAEDACISFVGSVASNAWPFIYHLDEVGASDFRRKKPAAPLVNQLKETHDPRLQVWVAPVHVKWVADPALTTAMDPFIRRNGEVLNGTISLPDKELVAQKAGGAVFTRHFNPTLYAAEFAGTTLDTSSYVGLPTGLFQPDYYNRNPTPGQTVENQHVSQLSNLYRYSNNPNLLKARLIHSAEVSFILAEAALKGWNVGNAEAHYNEGIKLSLQTWGVGEGYDAFMTSGGVKYDGTLKQIITQKWVASWSGAIESWMDYRRTGYPELQGSAAADHPVLPVRLIYGNEEASYNRTNTANAINALEQTKYSSQPNSQWSKIWLLKGINKPW